MGRLWMWIVGVVVVVALGGGVFYLVTRDGGSSSGEVVQTGDSADPGATKTACDIFTEAIAKQVLGEGAVKSEAVPGGNASTDDVSVTNCAYEVEEGLSLRVANILVRGAKNGDAYSTNEFGFNDTRDYGGFEETEPAASEAIADLGGDAYYNPAFEQVNVLINGGQYWIIVQADGGREPSEQLARTVVENL